jgi:hypothetical protein
MNRDDRDEIDADGQDEANDLHSALTQGETEFVSAEPRQRLSGSTLVFAGLLLAAGATMYFMYWRSGPRVAAAKPNPESVEASKAINSFLSDAKGNLKLMEVMLRNTERVVQRFLSYPSLTQVPLTDLKTNPFRLRGPTTQPGLMQAEVDPSIEKRRLETERAEALAKVRTLKLQSILHSETRKACMINNALYGEGQTVNGFTIERITPSAVIVKSGGVRFEVKMQK